MEIPGARRAGAWMFAAGSFALSATAAPIEVTTTPVFNNFGPSTSGDGKRIAFYSAADITGGNPDHSFEIFLFDRPTNTITQVTNFAGGALKGGNQAPRISDDGNRIVFQHFETSGGISDFQSLYYDIPSASFTTLTSLGFFEAGDINGNGTKIALSTDNTGIRIYDTTTASFGSVFGSLGAGAPRISADGTRITWEAFGNQSKFFDTTTATTTPVNAAGSGLNQNPDISADGSRIAYSSTGNPVGTNPENNPEIFLYNTAGGATTQLTSAAAGTSFNATISGDGTRVAFSSNADLTGGNPDNNFEIFVYDVPSAALTQITDSTGGFNDTPSLSADGLTLAFISNRDLTGGNSDLNPELFYTTLASRAQAAAPSSLLLLLAALLALAPGALKRGAPGVAAG
jgi:Tol biopolymer transport system component